MSDYHFPCQIDYPTELYELCEELQTFKYLVSYPCLLFKWQNNYPKDTLRIATIASHRLEKHTWCETTEKCWTVEEFIRKYDTKIV